MTPDSLQSAVETVHLLQAGTAQRVVYPDGRKTKELVVTDAPLLTHDWGKIAPRLQPLQQLRQQQAQVLPTLELAAKLPPHKTYVELCSGVPLFLSKDPSPVEVVNDTRESIVQLFRILRTPRRAATFALLQRLYPVQQPAPEAALLSYLLREGNQLIHCFAWYWLAVHVFNRYRAATQQQQMFPDDQLTFRVFDDRQPEVQQFYRTLARIDENLPDIHGRIFRVQLECYPWEKILKIYDSAETLFFVDLRHHDEPGLREALTQVKGQVVSYAD